MCGVGNQEGEGGVNSARGIYFAAIFIWRQFVGRGELRGGRRGCLGEGWISSEGKGKCFQIDFQNGVFGTMSHTGQNQFTTFFFSAWSAEIKLDLHERNESGLN